MKRKIIMAASSLILLVILLDIGNSFAWFSSSPRVIKNVFRVVDEKLIDTEIIEDELSGKWIHPNYGKNR